MGLRVLAASFAIALGAPVAAQAPTPWSQPPTQSAPGGPTVICGTTVIPANPAVDPLFIQPAPRGTFTMRTMQSGACHGSRDAVRLQQRLPQFLGPKR